MVEQKKRLKIAHVIPDSGYRDRQLLFEFTVHALKDQCALHFYILSGNESLKTFLQSENVPYTYLNYKPKSIWDILREAWSIKKELRVFDVVHTHYHDANLIGLISAKIAGVHMRVHTRHHNSFFHDTNNRKNVLMNRVMNALSTFIVAPSRSVYKTLVDKEKVLPSKVSLIHHPFSFSSLRQPTLETENVIRKKYGIERKAFVIGAISSFQLIKGTDLIVDAYEKVLETIPNAILVLANAHGPLKKLILNRVHEIKHGKVILIAYENDVLSLYRAFNVFVHIPRTSSSEAFGQVYIESMAMGIPGVFTPSGVLPEIAENGKNCLLVEFKDVPATASAILRIAKSKEFASYISANAQKTIKNRFDVESFGAKLMNIYQN